MHKLFQFFLGTFFLLCIDCTYASKVENLASLAAKQSAKLIDDLDMNDTQKINCFKNLSGSIPPHLEKIIVANATPPFLIPFSHEPEKCGYFSENTSCLIDGFEISLASRGAEFGRCRVPIDSSVSVSDATFIRKNFTHSTTINDLVFDVSSQYPETYKSIAVAEYFAGSGSWCGFSALYFMKAIHQTQKVENYTIISTHSKVIKIVDEANQVVVGMYTHDKPAVFEFLNHNKRFLYMVSRAGHFFDPEIWRFKRDSKILEKIDLATLIRLKQIAQYKQLTLAKFKEEQVELFAEYEKLDKDIKKIVKFKPEDRALHERT